MAKRRGTGAGMSRYERLAGWCYLPFYVFLLSFILQQILPKLGFALNERSLNLAFFLIYSKKSCIKFCFRYFSLQKAFFTIPV